MDDGADTDGRLIAATLASERLQKDDQARPRNTGLGGGSDLFRMSGCAAYCAGETREVNAVQECRRQAEKCIEESTKAPHPALRAHWLALAEQWGNTAERLFKIESERRS